MSIDASPPQTPPQMSPDGQWVWDGREWQPVGTHKSVFPSWNAIQVGPPVVEVAPVVVRLPEPVVSYPVAYAEPEQPARLWEEGKTTSYDRYLYAGAAAVVLLMAMYFLSTLGTISFPWSSSETRATPSPSPVPPATRTDYARADRFLHGTLEPSVASLNQTLPVLQQTCNGVLTVSCQSAIGATDRQVKSFLAAIDRDAPPTCIAVQAGKLRADLVNMDGGLQSVLKGYADTSRPEVLQGLGLFGKAGQAYQADAASIAPAQKVCNTQVTGP